MRSLLTSATWYNVINIVTRSRGGFGLSETRRKDNRQVNFRVSEEDLEILDTQARILGVSIPAFCRAKAKGIRVRYPKIDRESALILATELRRIGNNINQAVKVLNQSGGHRSDIETLQGALSQIWQLLSSALQNPLGDSSITAKEKKTPTRLA